MIRPVFNARELARAVPQTEALDVDLEVPLSAIETRLAEVLEVVYRLVEAPAPSHEPPPLSARQLEVLQLLAEGRSTAAIARQLWLSPSTVRNHVTAILRGLNAHSRLEAVAIARRRSIV